MAKRARPALKRGRTQSKSPPVAAAELLTLLDFVRYATSRFIEAKLVFAHGTTDPVAEAVFLVCESLHLHPDQFETFATARVTAAEAKAILDLIARRIATRKPAAYLVNKIYMRGLPFYVDERTIVPRSFIGELLEQHFGGEGDAEGGSLIENPGSVKNLLDLCTGSGCLAILAARAFAEAQIDAVDISKDALDVAARNVAAYGLEDRVTLHRGDLFKPLGGSRYDLIISNPPYVDAQGMAELPRECRAEPKLAFDGRRWIGDRPPHFAAGRAASDATGRTIVRDRAWPRAVGGRFSAIAAVMARYRGVPRRGVLDRRRRSVSSSPHREPFTAMSGTGNSRTVWR